MAGKYWEQWGAGGKKKKTDDLKQTPFSRHTHPRTMERGERGKASRPLHIPRVHMRTWGPVRSPPIFPMHRPLASPHRTSEKKVMDTLASMKRQLTNIVSLTSSRTKYWDANTCASVSRTMHAAETAINEAEESIKKFEKTMMERGGR